VPRRAAASSGSIGQAIDTSGGARDEEDWPIVGIVGIAAGARGARRRTSRTRALAAATAASATVALTGCAANFSAPTNEPYQPAAGISVRSGEVYAIDTLVVTDGSGNGTVVASLINQQADDDTLQSYTATDSSGNEITTAPLSQPIDLPAYPSPHQAVQVGTAGDLRLSGDNVTGGTFVDLTFTFGNAAPVKVEAPVVVGGADSLYANIPVGPASTGGFAG
jgi:hypothetical protein